MPKFNTSFDLNVRDIELIESALGTHKKTLSMERLSLLEQDAAGRQDELREIEGALDGINALLGRLHNQKIFYRPKSGDAPPYISG